MLDDTLVFSLSNVHEQIWRKEVAASFQHLSSKCGNLPLAALVNGDAALVVALLAQPVALLLDHVQPLLQLTQVHLARG